MSHCLRFLLSNLALLLFSGLQAQQFLPDSSAAEMAKAQTMDTYHSFMGVQAPLYNGKTFVGHLPLKGTPYFLEDSLDYGQVMYDGILYSRVPMFYDLISDQLIVVNMWGGMLAPVPERISEFTISGHHFIRDRGDFYDLLAAGPVTLLARRTKVVMENINQQELVRDVSERDHYYLLKGGVYHPIGGVKALLSLLRDRKKDIQQYLRQQKIKRHRDEEKALVAAVRFYNQSLPR